VTEILGLRGDTVWTAFIQRPPTSVILEYIAAKWFEYAEKFSGLGEPLAQRSEPVLTEGLYAFLAEEAEAGRQPFDGDFLAERKRYDLQKVDGRAVCTGRTDIEWLLYGFPAFIVEFKLLGGGRYASKYVMEGLSRFVDGRYGAKSSEGAMCALIRPDATQDHTHVIAELMAHSTELKCVGFGEELACVPSKIAPTVAQFDSAHDRAPAHPAIQLAHMFLAIPDRAPAP